MTSGSSLGQRDAIARRRPAHGPPAFAQIGADAVNLFAMPVTLIMMRCKKTAGMIEPGGDLPKGPAQHPATRPSSNQTEAGDPMDQGSRSSRSIISLFGPLLVIAASAAAASI